MKFSLTKCLACAWSQSPDFGVPLAVPAVLPAAPVTPPDSPMDVMGYDSDTDTSMEAEIAGMHMDPIDDDAPLADLLGAAVHVLDGIDSDTDPKGSDSSDSSSD